MGNTPDFWYLSQLVQYPEREVINVPYGANIEAKVHQIHRIACSKAPAGKYIAVAFFMHENIGLHAAEGEVDSITDTHLPLMYKVTW